MNKEELVSRGIERISTTSNDLVCKLSDISIDSLQNIFLYFLLPVLIFALFLLILKFKKTINEYILSLFSKAGYIKIWMIQDNKNIAEKHIKLDKYNNFKFKRKKLFNLDKMQEYIIGYSKNMPVFMYHNRFIFPLKLDKQKLTEELMKTIKNPENNSDKENNKIIESLVLKIDSSILDLVYDKKLLSDLYSISTSDGDLNQKIFWAVIIAVGLLVAYYTGMLDIVLSYLQ